MIDVEYVTDFKDFYEEHEEFIQERYKESSVLCGTTKPLVVDTDLWQQLIEIQAIILLEIFENDNFIGYCSINIIPSTLSKGDKTAIIDHFALSKDARHKGFATEVLQKIEYVLAAEGINDISIMFPPTELHTKFCSKNNYTKSAIMHTKSLGEANE